MEIILAGMVAGMGYVLSKNNHPRKQDVNFLNKVSPNFKPSPNNIYDNTRTQTVWNDQQQLANKIFAKSKNSLETNYMIAGPPVPIFNKVDGTDNTLPVEFIGANGLKEKAQRIEDQLKPKMYTPNIDPQVNDLDVPTLYKDFAATGGWEGISLTGNPIDRQSFFFNNMVPFFGGTAKQNMQENANVAILENFTGNDTNYQQKMEVKKDDFFQPVANLSNVFGMSNLDGYNYDRYIVSNLRNNQAPVEPIRVGPGLNEGYTAEPSGGFQQANTRDFVLPKTVNELRTKTKPKVSYEGVIIPGASVGKKPGKVGLVEKNHPDTFYVNSPDRLFTAVGDTTGPTQRPNVVLKYTNRKTTELKNMVGPAAPAAIGSQAQLKPGFKKSTKFQFANSGPRNQNAQGQWQINGPNSAIPNDYGRSSMKVKPNSRMCTEGKMQITNFNPINKNNRAPENPNIKHTRKTNIVGNNRWSGNFQNTGPNKPKVYDPNDVPRTTIKEQNIDNNYQGNFQNTGPTKPTVYDPNDLPRTTIKEQNIDNSYQGNFQSSGPYKPTVYDPNDILRTTIKEQNIDNSYQGNFQNTGPQKPTVYDPNDILRTTIKEQNIDNSYQGNFQNTGPQKPTVYDPNDVFRTTIKEQNIDNSYQGNFQNTGPQKATVYDPNDVFRTTIKEQNIDNSHIGYFSSTGPKKPKVYDPNDVLRTTIKEQSVDNKYVGGIKGSGKGMVYDPNNVPRNTIKQQTMVYNNMGNMSNQGAGGGYKNVNMKAKNTQRITTSVQYVGDAKGPSVGGYRTARVAAKNTARQFQSDNEVKGNAGPASVKAPTSYDEYYNREIKSVREQVAVGRKPAHQGPKTWLTKDDINMQITRHGDQDNSRIENRGVMSTKVYNSTPQPNLFGETHYKDTLPNAPLADRINPEILDAFRKNPYTQSLHSFAFQ